MGVTCSVSFTLGWTNRTRRAPLEDWWSIAWVRTWRKLEIVASHEKPRTKGNGSAMRLSLQKVGWATDLWPGLTETSTARYYVSLWTRLRTKIQVTRGRQRIRTCIRAPSQEIDVQHCVLPLEIAHIRGPRVAIDNATEPKQSP